MSQKNINAYIKNIKNCHQIVANAEKTIRLIMKESPEMYERKEEDRSKGIELLKWTCITTSILTLAALSKFHDLSSRYPNGSLNPWDYNEELGIVKALPDLTRCLESSATNMRELYPMLEKSGNTGAVID